MSDGAEKNRDVQGRQPAPGFRFMGKSLGELLDLKASLRRRLAFLEENRARISPFVLRKLTQEYNSYLETVDSELALNLCEYEIKLSELRLFSGQLQLLRKTYSDNIEEIKLRHALGEYGQEEYSRLIHDHSERMHRFEENLARYDSEERKIQAFLERIGSGDTVADAPESVSAQGMPASEQPADMAAAPVAGPEPELTAESEPLTEAVPFLPAEPPEQPRPAASRLELHESRSAGLEKSTVESVPPGLAEMMTSSVAPEQTESAAAATSADSDLAGLPGLEEIFSAPESKPEDIPVVEKAPEDDSLPAAGGQSAGADELFEALMRESAVQPQPTPLVQPDAESLSVQAPEEPTPVATEPPAEKIEVAQTPSAVTGSAGSPMDELERDLMQIKAPAPTEVNESPGGGNGSENDSSSKVASLDLDLESLMDSSRIPEPVLPPPVSLDQEPAPLSATAEMAPAETAKKMAPPAAVVSAPLEKDTEEPSELRWEPLPREMETPPAPQTAGLQPEKAVRRALPLDDRIELTLDLDRSELDPQKILTVNQTIDAIKKKTVKCPNCGTMNYAIRWYCENCEATLTTL